MKKISSLMVIITAALTFLSCRDKGVIVVFDGGTITEKDIEKQASGQIFPLQQQIYEIKKQMAMQKVRDILMEKEARAAGKDPDQYLNEYIGKNVQAPDEKTLENFYAMNRGQIKEPYPAIRDRLADYLLNQKKNEARQTLEANLFKKYGVDVVLTEPVASKIDIDIANEPYWGQEKAKVVFVEFSDFECPYCQRMQADVRRIREEYSGKIKWVFKDFPLNFHAQSKKAHIAANCAGEQKKYFDMQYKLFSGSTFNEGGQSKFDLREDTIKKYAREIRLDMTAFNACLADGNGAQSKEIDDDIAYGESIGVRGTPTLYVNGELAQGRDYAGLKRIIDARL